jgi:hypothetical protein
MTFFNTTFCTRSSTDQSDPCILSTTLLPKYLYVLHTGINNDICQIPGGDISQNGVDYVKNISAGQNKAVLAQLFNNFCIGLSC